MKNDANIEISFEDILKSIEAEEKKLTLYPMNEVVIGAMDDLSGPKKHGEMTIGCKKNWTYESIMSKNGEDFIKAVYDEFLDREPDDEGLKNLFDLLKKKDNSKDLILVSVALSDEGISKHNYLKGANVEYINVAYLMKLPVREFVRQCYLWILGRLPDNFGMKHYTELIVSGKATKADVIVGIKNSNEGKNRRVRIEGLDGYLRTERIINRRSKFILFRKYYSLKKHFELIEFRIQDERGRMEERLAQERTQTEGRLAQERAQTEERLAQERAQTEGRLAQERTQTEERLAQERTQTEGRLAQERTQTEERLAQERTQTEGRLAQERTQTEGRLAQERAQTEESLAQERAQTEGRLTQERTRTEESLNKLFDAWMADGNKLERMNNELSGRPTIWGDKSRLHISPLAAVFTCMFNTNSGEIFVGDYTFAGSGVSILAGGHDQRLTGILRRDIPYTEGRDINIGKGVWLASNCTILGPCTIGDNSVIAAGAVVTPGTIVEPGCVYAGVPAGKLKKIDMVSETDYADASVSGAFERNGGILYCNGWTDTRACMIDNNVYLGHWMFADNAKLVINNADNRDDISFRYSLECEAPAEILLNLSTGCGEDTQKVLLKDKSGIFSVPLKKELLTVNAAAENNGANDEISSLMEIKFSVESGFKSGTIFITSAAD